MRNRGFSKNKLSHWFSEVKYSNYAKFLRKKKFSYSFLVETIPETFIDNSKGAAKVVSRDMVSMVALDNLNGLLFKGSSTEMFHFLFIYNKLQKNPCQFDCALSPYRQRRREDVLYFSRLSPGTKTKNGCNTIKIHQK